MAESHALVERLLCVVVAATNLIGGSGACYDSEDDSGYCTDEICNYCSLARAVDKWKVAIVGRNAMDGVGEGTWAVFAEKVVHERDEARIALYEARAKIDRMESERKAPHTTSESLRDILEESLEALKRCLPQLRGALVVQDAEAAIRRLELALKARDGSH